MKAYYAFHDRLLSAFGVACCIVLVLIAVTLQLSKNAADAIDWVQHTYDVLTQIVQAKSHTIQIELSTQSFRISGDEHHIIERDQIIRDREQSLRLIQLATIDNPVQQQRWQQLRDVINERLNISSHMVHIRRTQGIDAANAYIDTTQLPQTRDRIYSLWRDMENEERHLLEQRLADQARTRKFSTIAVMVAGTSLLALLVFTFIVIRKQVKSIYLNRKQLAESENSLSTTLYSIGDGVVATDTMGNITRMNPVAEALTGWPITEAKGRPIYEVFQIFNEDTGQASIIPIQSAIECRSVQGLEKNTVLKNRQGRLIPIADSAAPIMDSTEAVIGVVLVFRDVSTEREAERHIQAHNILLEQEVQVRTAELVASAEKLRKVTDNVPALIAYIDQQQRYVYANQQYVDRFFTSDIEHIQGLSVREVLGEERYQKAAPFITQALSGQSVNYDWEPFPNIWQMVNYVPTMDSHGHVDGYYVLIADITDRKLAEVAFYKLTHFDALTGLPNETQFTDLMLETIAACKQAGKTFPLVQINIEKLSEINDALGFSKGDEVLKQFSERLKHVAPTDSQIARLRGDEFAILLNTGGPEDAIRLVSDLETLWAESIVIADIPLDISAKIGIAVYPDHGQTPHDLYRHTDSAVRQAKKKGTRFQMFDHSQDSDKPHRLAMAAELRRGIDHHHMVLYLQPKVELSTGKTCGVEALVRWNHPKRGMISPAEFIPLAEQIGLIKPLTQWVIHTAMELIEHWQNSGFIMPIAINLSTRNLYEDDLVERIRRCKDTWQIGADLLEIEVTETSVMDDAQHALQVLHQLRQLGIPLSIDDFGTGYSSLSYLQRLPMQFIKIDQSFVRNMLLSKESFMIVRSTIELAHALDKKVVAEGVETQQQWNKLLELGCDIAQGYWIAKPMPAETFLEWTATQRLN